jgi:hypothetical protein
MYMHDIPLRIISLHDETLFLLSRSLGLLEQYNWDIVGDPQSAFSQLGDVILFIQTTMARFHVRSSHPKPACLAKPVIDPQHHCYYGEQGLLDGISQVNIRSSFDGDA